MTLKFSIPENWNNLTNKQLLKVANLFFGKVKNPAYQDYQLFKILANYKWYKFRLLKKINLLFRTIQLSVLKNHFNFIYQKQNLTRFIPVVKVGRKKYFAPADRLTNLSIGEFSITEDLYLGYLRNCNNKAANYGESYLYYLFAVLYTTNPNRKRPPFVKEDLETMVAAIEKVNKKHLLTTLLSYKGCREAITTNKKYKHIFPNTKQEATENIQIPTASGFSDIIISFSGDKFGTHAETFNTNIYTFLDAYEIAIKNQPKEEK